MTDVFEGAASAGVLLGHYSYDALSERTGIAYGGTTAAAGGRAPVATTAASFTSAGQISQLVHSLNGSALTLGYTYNQDHQRTGVSASDATYLVSGLTAVSRTYAPNNLNQYATVGATAYTYDTNGNLKSDGTWTYTYSNENILLTATATGSTVSYTYDPQNLRKAKTVNGTTTSYLSVGNQAVGDQGKGQEIAEYNGSGTLLRRYVYGLGLDEPLVTIDAAGNHSYHFTDGLGSVVALANTSGQLTEKHAYSAYGLASSTAGTAFQFAGRRVDPETGLYYNRARFYSPSLGRFLQTDPTGTKGGINLYAYTANDPVNRVDSTGRAWMSASSVNTFGQMNFGALSGANDEEDAESPLAAEVTLYKAPQAGRDPIPELTNGFDPKQYPGEGPFLAVDPSIAEGFQNSYQNGMQKFTMSASSFADLTSRGIIQSDSYYAPGQSINVPPEGLDEFNKAILQGSPNTYTPQ
jgi:RHS repeat-associated protein